MKVNETFLSLQGEGYFTGTAAFFLRLSGCNLRCPFCDTQHQSYTEMSEDEIVAEASRHKPRHIVITGGEPALQLSRTLVDKLHAAGFFIQVETNGTLPLPEGIDWVTCSPKGDFPQFPVDELKVLFMGDVTDPEAIISPLLGKESGVKLYLQPLDTGNEKQNRAILRSCINYVLQHPWWTLSLQTHKIIGIK